VQTGAGLSNALENRSYEVNQVITPKYPRSTYQHLSLSQSPIIGEMMQKKEKKMNMQLK